MKTTNEHHNPGQPLGLASSEGLAELVEKRRPLRIELTEVDGCCCWATFLEGFAAAWPRWFDTPPTAQQWRMAEADWRAGNTGWEGAHNAQRRVKARVQKRQHEAWASANAVLTRSSRG